MKYKTTGITAILSIILLSACNPSGDIATFTETKTRVIFDTDANNEIDDQFAMAYLLFNGNIFDVEGITVNATSGGGIDLEYAEAKRVMQLLNVYETIPLHMGADGSFEEIKGQVDNADFDGSDAVDFIIERAMANEDEKLVLLPVGKLTNIALALEKEPAIASRVHIVWLGSNYPEPGEHNQNWDPESMNYVLDTDVPFDMVTVRYGKPSGTSAVLATRAQVQRRMPGIGPVASEPVTGRHGGTFNNFGDYGVDLFENYNMNGNPPARPLFDMAAVAIVKNPSWAERREIPAPVLVDDQWVERPDNQRTITVWEHFDIYGIMDDFFKTMENPVVAGD
ncbi:MAG: nucleoside hydrolase [Balneolales bacterium]